MVPSVAIDNGNLIFLDQKSFHPLNLRPGFPTGNGWSVHCCCGGVAAPSISDCCSICSNADTVLIDCVEDRV